jgi:hypothetical protein
MSDSLSGRNLMGSSLDLEDAQRKIAAGADELRFVWGHSTLTVWYRAHVSRSAFRYLTVFHRVRVNGGPPPALLLQRKFSIVLGLMKHPSDSRCFAASLVHSQSVEVIPVGFSFNAPYTINPMRRTWSLNYHSLRYTLTRQWRPSAIGFIAQSMGALTEVEIFDAMYDNLQLAAQHAVDLARLPAQGPTYKKFRDEMLMVEGCCRQASAWREDTRWLQVGLIIADALSRTGNWLRGYRVHGQMGKVFTPRDLYLKLAENLQGIAKVIEGLRHGATGRMGMILPEIAKEIRTDGRPVQVMSPGGVILPA